MGCCKLVCTHIAIAIRSLVSSHLQLMFDYKRTPEESCTHTQLLAASWWPASRSFKTRAPVITITCLSAIYSHAPQLLIRSLACTACNHAISNRPPLEIVQCSCSVDSGVIFQLTNCVVFTVVLFNVAPVSKDSLTQAVCKHVHIV